MIRADQYQYWLILKGALCHPIGKEKAVSKQY